MAGKGATATAGKSVSIKRDLTRKPPGLPIITENVPTELRDLERWLGWRWQLNQKRDKWTKPPIDIRRDRLGSSTDSATWCDFATALAAAESGFVDGIGFALGDGFCGVDFDNCRDRETGDIAPDVQAYIHRLCTYGEVSPSGEGVKLILRGTLPKGRRANGNIEVYDSGRYFTVTGHRLDCCPADLAAKDRELAALHRELIEAPQTVSQHRRESSMSDRELAPAALAALSPSRAETYLDWLLVGMALHATDAGLLDAWDTWSQQSAKYSPGYCAGKWHTFNGSAVGLGSLIHWAKQDTDWTLPRRCGKARGIVIAREVPPYVPLPVEVLPAVIAEYVAAAATAIGCDPSFVALPLLTCLARAIGNKRVIEIKRSWTEAAILWAAIVGKSGTHKTPAIQAATRHLHRKQAEAIAQHAAAMAEHQDQVKLYERDLKAWNSARKSGPTEPPPQRPHEPVCQRYITTDTTVEALAMLLSVQFDGILVCRDELAGWLGGINEYKGGKGSDLGHWLACWSGVPHTWDRKTGAVKMIHVPRAAVSIVGGIQPGILRTAVGKEHLQDGLCARLLLAMPDPRPVRWTEAIIDTTTDEAIGRMVDRLLTLEPIADDEGNPAPLAMPLNDRAKLVWVEYFNRHRAELADLDDDLAAAWSKLEAYTARFALIFQLCSWGAGEQYASDQTIDEAAMQSAIALSDWCGNETRRVYAVLAESEAHREDRELVELIQRKGGSVTARELMRCSRRFPTSAEADAALDVLAQTGRGRWQVDNHAGGKGQPARRLILVDAIDGDTNSAKPEGNGNCVNASAVNGAQTINGNGCERPGGLHAPPIGTSTSEVAEGMASFEAERRRIIDSGEMEIPW